jgi:hypothetical protein
MASQFDEIPGSAFSAFGYHLAELKLEDYPGLNWDTNSCGKMQFKS